MAAFKLTVPIGGYDGTNPTSEAFFTADRGLSRVVKHRVLTAKFGDGYEQRVRDGINTKDDEFTANFNNRTSTEANNLAAFFDRQAGKSFTLTITDYAGDTAIKVVCDTYTLTYVQTTAHSINCNFRRVYEP